ncbi:SPOR domain-containing protein, partial [bacterium]|nr:SPOR domain-containing protein [bacterium]
ILSEDVLFVGIIEVQPDRYPKRIVYRLDRVVNPQRSAKDVVSRIEDYMTAESAGTSTVATAAPAASSQAPASTATAAPAENTSSAAASTSAETTPSERYDEAVSSNAVYNRPRPKNAEIPVSTTSTSNYWRCQVGAFASVDNARECYSLLASKGHVGRIERVEVGDLIRYKVFVGTFGSHDEAVPTLNRLKDDGFKTAYICAPSR